MMEGKLVNHKKGRGVHSESIMRKITGLILCGSTCCANWNFVLDVRREAVPDDVDE